MSIRKRLKKAAKFLTELYEMYNEEFEMEELEAAKLNEPPAKATPATKIVPSWPEMVTAEEFYARVSEECMLVESLIREYAMPLCEVLQLNPARVPVIVVVPSVVVAGGLDPDPSGCTLRVNDAGVAQQIRVAGVRTEGAMVLDEEDQEVFAYFARGSQPYVRAFLESFAMQLIHIHLNTAKSSDAIFDATQKVAYRMAHNAVNKILGAAPEGWGLIEHTDEYHGDN